MTSADVPQIPRLLATEQGPLAESPSISRAVIENLMPPLFIDTPHADPQMPGLVSIDDDGRLTGMIGRIARQMEFRGQPIRAAVACELFVDPAHRSKMLGVKLLKQVMAGPQDLLISDIANETSRKIWTGLGGSIATWYGLTWVKVLQPAQFALSILCEKRFGKLLWAGRPLASLTDRVLGQKLGALTRLGPEPPLESESLTPELFLDLFPQFTESDELRPIYDRETIDWIWPRLDFLYAAGPSVQRLVKSPAGEPLGWYVYQMTDRRIVRVAQIVAFPKTIGSVLDHLLHEVAQRGAIAVTGRIIPRFVQTFVDRSCVIRGRRSHTLVHARDPQLLEAFTTGRAFLSLFESEGPLQIWINPLLALERMRLLNSAKSHHSRDETTIMPKRPKASEYITHALEL